MHCTPNNSTKSWCLSRRCGKRLLLVKAGWILGLFVLACGVGQAQTVSVTDPTGWNAWQNQQGTYVVDPASDQQTGQPSDDFVGTTTTAAFQQKAGSMTVNSVTEQYILFRARFGEFTPGGNGGNFSLGIDLTGNGEINMIMRLNYKGTTGANVSIDFAKPGTGANDGPSTTSWGNFNTLPTLTTMSSSTYNYAGVSDGVLISPTKNPYTQNAWVTFAISYANLQAAIRAYAAYYTLSGATYTETAGYFSGYTLDDFSAMSFIAFTSTQNNAINQDLLGTDGNTKSTATFASLGAGTTYIRPGGGPIPEPAAIYQLGGLLGAGLIGFFVRRRREARITANCAGNC